MSLSYRNDGRVARVAVAELGGDDDDGPLALAQAWKEAKNGTDVFFF